VFFVPSVVDIRRRHCRNCWQPSSRARKARRQASAIVSADRRDGDGARNVYSPGAIAIEGQDIVAVGAAADIAARFKASQQIDARGSVVIPGLINTHTHAPMVLYRGLADDLPLQEWLEKYIFPAEAKTVSREMVQIGTRLAVLEMIQSGTTAYADMYYFEEEMARVTKAAGLRGVLGQTVIQFPVADARTPQEALTRAEAFIKEFQHDELIVPAVAPHAPYTNDAKTLLASRALATKYNVPVLIHVAETEVELKNSQAAHAWHDPGRLPAGNRVLGTAHTGESWGCGSAPTTCGSFAATTAVSQSRAT
jgi:5-methylthioadenosine/S-adenosylhomocysteine deaminase